MNGRKKTKYWMKRRSSVKKDRTGGQFTTGTQNGRGSDKNGGPGGPVRTRTVRNVEVWLKFGKNQLQTYVFRLETYAT